MLRMYINLFLTLLIPVNILSIFVAIIILALKFELFEAIQLGILAGVATGISLSALLALLLLVKRRLETTEITSEPEPQVSVPEDANLEKIQINKNNNTFILFMNNMLAFETSTYIITKNMIGDIIKMDVKRGIIDIKDSQNVEYRLNIQPLTTNTTIVEIETSDGSNTTGQITYALKEMNRSFMRY